MSGSAHPRDSEDRQSVKLDTHNRTSAPEALGEDPEENYKSARSPHEEWPELDLDIEENLQYYWEHDRRRLFTDKVKAEAWAKMDGAVNAYSDDLVRRWNKEIDSLLTYAGLFSAILTAFNVESYPLLNQTTPDPVLATLQQISIQMRSFSLTPPFLNATDTPPMRIEMTPQIESWKIWLNALWFSSLICSLSAASIGIMVKQWLSEHASGLYGNTRQTGRLRQYRLDGLRKWHVAEIVAIIPVLLLVALFLFFAGLLVLLSQLNTAVTAVAAIFIGVLVAFTSLTTILPAWHTDCSYVSPQSLCAFYTRRYVQAILGAILSSNRGDGPDVTETIVDPPGTSASLEIPSAPTMMLRIWIALVYHFQRIDARIAYIGAQMRSLNSRLKGVRVPHHRSLELTCVEDTRKTLDVSTLAMALPIGGDQSLLDGATACFSDLAPQQVLDYCQKVEADYKSAAGDQSAEPRVDRWFARLPRDICSDILVALSCTPQPPESVPDESLARRLQCIMHALTCGPEMPEQDVARLSLTLDNLAGIIVAHKPSHPENQFGRPTSILPFDHLASIASATSDLWARTQLERPGITFDEVTYRRVVRAVGALLSERLLRRADSSGAYSVYRPGANLLMQLCIGHDSPASPGTIEARRDGDRPQTAGSDAIVTIVRQVRAYASQALPLLLNRAFEEMRDDKFYLHLFVRDGILDGVRRAGLVSPELLDLLSRYVREFEPVPGEYWRFLWMENEALISNLKVAKKRTEQSPLAGRDNSSLAHVDGARGSQALGSDDDITSHV